VSRSVTTVADFGEEGLQLFVGGGKGESAYEKFLSHEHVSFKTFRFTAASQHAEDPTGDAV